MATESSLIKVLAAELPPATHQGSDREKARKPPVTYRSDSRAVPHQASDPRAATHQGSDPRAAKHQGSDPKKGSQATCPTSQCSDRKARTTRRVVDGAGGRTIAARVFSNWSLKSKGGVQAAGALGREARGALSQTNRVSRRSKRPGHEDHRVKPDTKTQVTRTIGVA